MVGYPKPSKKARKKEELAVKKDLAKYRQEQAFLAFTRDDGYCVFCYFLENKLIKAEDVHHTYGRARKLPDWRETAEYLVDTCRGHHPPPIKSDIPSPNMQYVEDVRQLANANPISKRKSLWVGKKMTPVKLNV